MLQIRLKELGLLVHIACKNCFLIKGGTQITKTAVCGWQKLDNPLLGLRDKARGCYMNNFSLTNM
jgi:hypothetical protein